MSGSAPGPSCLVLLDADAGDEVPRNRVLVRVQLPIGVVIGGRNQTQIAPPAHPCLAYEVADDHVGQLQSVAGWQLPDRF